MSEVWYCFTAIERKFMYLEKTCRGRKKKLKKVDFSPLGQLSKWLSYSCWSLLVTFSSAKSRNKIEQSSCGMLKIDKPISVGTFLSYDALLQTHTMFYTCISLFPAKAKPLPYNLKVSHEPLFNRTSFEASDTLPSWTTACMRHLIVFPVDPIIF